MIADVYRNLTKGRWSVRNRKTGRVSFRRLSLVLSECTFHVSPAGRERVRREKRKNVHAVIRGTLRLGWMPKNGDSVFPWQEVLYENESFVTTWGAVLVGSTLVEFMESGRVFAFRPEYQDFSANLKTVV